MHKMKKGKAIGTDEVRLDMLEMAGKVGVKWTGRLLDVCVREGRVPKEWRLGLIVPIWKRKGDVHGSGNYRGITLLSQILKLLERVLDARFRRRVEGDFGEEQQGCRKGRGTTDEMYVMRQMVEKRLEVQGSMALGFVDLVKAFDRVLREMVTATPYGGWDFQKLKWGWLRARTRRQQQEWWWEKELRRSLRSILDNTRHGLTINLQKMEVLHIGHQREELDIELEGKKLTQRDSFVYLGDGNTEREVRRREQAGANAWRAVEGVMADRRISERLNGKVMITCV